MNGGGAAVSCELSARRGPPSVPGGQVGGNRHGAARAQARGQQIETTIAQSFVRQKSATDEKLATVSVLSCARAGAGSAHGGELSR